MMFLLLVFLLPLSTQAEPRRGCANVEIVPRQEWMPREPFRTWDMKLPVNHVVIIHTVDPRFCRDKPECLWYMKAMQDYHMDDKGWWDIGYNFVLGNDGRIYEGRGWNKTGAHSGNLFNYMSIGLAFVGNYNIDKPTELMLNAALDFIACGEEKGYLTPSAQIHGHRDVSCTESPGNNLYEVIRTWKNYIGGRLPDFHCNNQTSKELKTSKVKTNKATDKLNTTNIISN